MTPTMAEQNDLNGSIPLQRSNATDGAGRGDGAYQRTADCIVEPCNVMTFFFVVGFLSLSILIFIFNLQHSNATTDAGRGWSGGGRQRTWTGRRGKEKCQGDVQEDRDPSAFL